MVRLLDKVAYLSGDVNDTIRAYEQELIELPDNLVSEMRWRASLLGENQHLFLTNCVIDLVNESREKGYVSFSDCPRAEALWSFRKFMYKNIYDKIDWSLEERYLKNIFEFFTGFSMLDGCDPALLLACLTDDEATMLGNQLEHELRPSYEELTKLGFYELLPIFRGLGMVNLTDPQLDEDMFHTSFH